MSNGTSVGMAIPSVEDVIVPLFIHEVVTFNLIRKIRVQLLIDVEDLVVPFKLLWGRVLNRSFSQNGIMLGQLLPVLAIVSIKIVKKKVMTAKYLWTLASEAHDLNISVDLFGRPFQIFIHHPTVFPLLSKLHNFIFSRLRVLLVELENLRVYATAWRSTLIL